jgi:hypothetical protein
MIRTRQSKCKSETKHQNECETITNDNLNQIVFDDVRRESIKKIVFDDLKFRRSSFSCFYRTQMTWNIIIDYFSHAFTKERNDVWIKQTNKQTNKWSIAKIKQFTILQRLNDSIKLNKSIVKSKIQFDINRIFIMNTIELKISLKLMIFHIIKINISFLFYSIDLNRLEMYFNNLINESMQKCFIIKNSSFAIIIILQIDMKNLSSIIILQTDMKNVDQNRRFLVIQRYEHAFLLWKISHQYQFLIVDFLNENLCYLIEIELRRLHCCFDHFSARRLHQIFYRFKHDVEYQIIEHFIKFYHHCQMHEKSSNRFIFSIRNEEIQFNFNILMNILYIEIKIENENKFVLHLMNEAIRFQIDKWLKNIQRNTFEISCEHVELIFIWDYLTL